MTRCIHNRQECQGLEASSLAWLSKLVWIVTKSLVSNTLLIYWDYEMINMIPWKDNNNTVERYNADYEWRHTKGAIEQQDIKTRLFWQDVACVQLEFHYTWTELISAAGVSGLILLFFLFSSHLPHSLFVLPHLRLPRPDPRLTSS